jgi:hypothetical protein
MVDRQEKVKLLPLLGNLVTQDGVHLWWQENPFCTQSTQSRLKASAPGEASAGCGR